MTHTERLIILENIVIGNGHPGLVKIVDELRKDIQEVKITIESTKHFLLWGIPITTTIFQILLSTIFHVLFH